MDEGRAGAARDHGAGSRGKTAGTALACVSAQLRPQARFTGHRSVHRALRAWQALVTSRGALSAVSFAQAVTRVWPTLSAAVALASALVMWGSCADLSEFRTDLSHLEQTYTPRPKACRSCPRGLQRSVWVLLRCINARCGSQETNV